MPIKRLNARHHRIMEFYLEGVPRGEIARRLDPPMTPEAVGMIINSPLFQNEAAQHRKLRQQDRREMNSSTVGRAKAMFEESASRAAQAHVDLLEYEDPRVVQASANAILDRVYGKEGGTKPAVIITAEQLNVLQIAMSEDSD